jgi:iron(III) transport system ATP-binding protein
VILLDEPFAHLDAQLRSEIRAEVRGILRAAGATAILVTHDRTEALTMGDRVAVMIGGRVRQAGTAEEVYRHPADAEVGRLLGDADLLPGRAEHGEIVTEAGRLRPAVAPEVSGPVSVLLRPDNLRLTARADARAEVVERTFLGGEIRCTVRMASGVMVRCRAPASSGLDVGTRVSIVPTGEPVAWFPGERREAGRPAVAPISAPA